jgi:hypothetical protein
MTKVSLHSKLRSKLLVLLDKKRQQLITKKEQRQNKPSIINMWDPMVILARLKRMDARKKKKMLFFINFFNNNFFSFIFTKYFFSNDLLIISFYFTNTEFFFLKCYCSIIKQIHYFSLQLLYKVIYTVIYIYPIQLNLFNKKPISIFFSYSSYNVIKKKNQLSYLFLLFLLFFLKKLCLLNNFNYLTPRYFRLKRKFFLNLIWFRSYLTAWFLQYYPNVF